MKSLKNTIKDMLFGQVETLDAKTKPSTMSPELATKYWQAKYEQACLELEEFGTKYKKLKDRCDDISNRNTQLELEHRDIIDSEMVLIAQYIPKSASALCITTKHESLLDHKTWAHICHVLRTKCPWLDLCFMIHGDVELKTLSDEDLDAIGLQRKTNASGGIQC